MKKSTKGAFAAGTAAVLLLGGAGTLAYWTDDATVDGGEIESGSITLTAPDCSAAAWKHAEDDSDVDLLVPGDEIYKECAATLVLVGDHIGATVEIDAATAAAFTETSANTDMVSELSLTAGLVDGPGGAALASVSGAGSHDVIVRVEVDWDRGTVSAPDPRDDAKNDSQVATATLNEIGIIAVQTHE